MQKGVLILRNAGNKFVAEHEDDDQDRQKHVWKLRVRAGFKRSVLKLKTKAENKSEDKIGRFTPSDWPNREQEAQETGWARFRFQVLFNRFCI